MTNKVLNYPILSTAPTGNGESVYEQWLKLDGNAGKTFEQMLAEVRGKDDADGLKGVSSSVASLSTSTSTGLSAVDSSVASLSTSTSTSLSAVDSSVASLSTSTSTSLSAVDSSVASLSTSTSTSLSAVSSAVALLSQIDTRPIVIVTTGQSNAVGQRDDGPNPADPNVKVWDGLANAWGSSDIKQAPFSHSQPNGNLSKNSIGLAYAHRMRKETKRPVYLIHDAYSGKPIEDWMGAGTASVRYAALATKVVNALQTPELAGVTEIDYLLYTQGEENALKDMFNDYLSKFTTLDKQFRAESWMGRVTPMLVFGLSNLHNRYQVCIAQEYYCAELNPNCIYVNGSGLETKTPDMVGDETHFTGEALWEHGYYRAYSALNVSGGRPSMPAPMFFSRGVGLYNGDGTTAIANFSSLVSIDAVTSKFPFNAVSAVGSITWGPGCSADGNHTFAGGVNVVTDNLCNYSFGWGRDIKFGADADNSVSFGFQNLLKKPNQAVFGRGNTACDAGSTIIGTFAKYSLDEQTAADTKAGKLANPVIFQAGIGDTDANRRNAITVRKSGCVEIDVNHTADPEQPKEINFSYVNNSALRVKMRGDDGIVRFVDLQLRV